MTNRQKDILSNVLFVMLLGVFMLAVPVALLLFLKWVIFVAHLIFGASL